MRKLPSPAEATARYQSLPLEIKALIYSPEMLMTVRQVAQKHQLHIDQTGILEDETNALMLGFTSTEEYPDSLMTTLQVEKGVALSIAKDINELLFEKIREAMKKVYEANKTVEPEMASAPAAVAAAPTMPPVSKLPPLQHASPMASPPSTPAAASLPSAPTPPVPPPQKPTAAPPIHTVDLMLNEKTVATTPTPQPPEPGVYKKDPYRESAE